MKNPLQPYLGKLGIHRASHLLRRTSYNLTMDRIEQFSQMTVKEAMVVLFAPNAFANTEPIDFTNKRSYLDVHRGKRRRLVRDGGSGFKWQAKSVIGWWIDTARKDTSIHSKLTFFLHQNFAIEYLDNRLGPHDFYDYLRLMNDHVLKSYKDLAYEVVVNNQMLEYLDNYTNSKDNPNENFAREFFELFTIGKGKQLGPGNYTTYTEDDVRTAARLLTGFVKGPKEKNFKASLEDEIILRGASRGDVEISAHDTTNKVFSNAFDKRKIKGATTEHDMWRELSDFVNMIFDQKATALNICRKIYRFFVNAEIDESIEKYIIHPLAKVLQTNNYEIEPVMRRLLMSRHFLGDTETEESIAYIGGLVKSPLELTLQTISFFNVTLPDPIKKGRDHYLYWFILGLLSDIYTGSMGFTPFAPQDVAGYPAYYQAPQYSRGWINSTSIVGRYQFIVQLIRPKEGNQDFGGVQLDIVDFVQRSISEPMNAEEVVKTLVLYLFPLPLSKDRFDYFLKTTFLDGYSEKVWSSEWRKYKKTNDASIVRPSLERLLVAVVNAPEFQVM